MIAGVTSARDNPASSPEAPPRGVRGVDQTDQVALHLADQHHTHHLDGFGGGDAKPAAELRFNAEPDGIADAVGRRRTR